MNWMRLSIVLGVLLSVPVFGAEDWFSFQSPEDNYGREALLDLRTMNLERAGANGWIVNKDGHFVEADTGEKIRFLSVNGPNPWGRRPFGSPQERRALAALLAKRGINLQRIGPVRGAHKMSDEQVQGFLDLIEAGAEYGIYSGATFFFPLEVRVEGIPGYEKRGVQSLVFFHPKARAAYFELLEKLVHTPDDNTGKTLCENKAVAYIEIINEDNLFFFTFAPSKMPDEVRQVLEAQYGDWLAKKYGSITKTLEAWGGENAGLKRDAPDAGRMELYDASWYMDADWALQQRDPERAADQLRFMSHLQMQFYGDVKQQLREWGYGGCVLTTNWKTSSHRVLDALDKYTNTVGDMMDRHAYFGTPHQKAKFGNSIKKNGIYASDSALDDPTLLIAGIEYENYPEILSEYQYPAPNHYRAEGVWLGAHYGALLDIDGFSFNEIHSAEWQDSLRVFNVLTPLTAQQFPAAAYVYREGLIETAEPVARQVLSPEDLMELKGSAFWDRMNIDEMRAAEVQGKAEMPEDFDPLMWMVGPVRIAFGEETKAPEIADLSPFIKRDAKTVMSRTKQLKWDYGTGVVTADAPAVQSACGFLGKAGPIELSQCVIDIKNRYATVWLVALDGKPIATSERMLLQVMTEERPKGWAEEPAEFTDRKGEKHSGMKILETGGKGWEIRSIQGSIALKRPDAAHLIVQPVDANFFPQGAPLKGLNTLQLKPDVLHYIIRVNE